ncbi:D-alanine--D-alanine ligase [bacterium]|nr:D-alanine--D-alanine ligase [bacterium]
MGKLGKDLIRQECPHLKSGLKIGVLMGGWSKEREISLITGRAIIEALTAKGWQVTGIDVDRNICNRIREEKINAAFLALHGRYGEDGSIQGMLEIMGIPYTGSGVLASSLAIDKAAAKRFFQIFEIPTPCFETLEKGDTLEESPFGYPLVVKPCSQGSTIGTHIVKDQSDLAQAVSDAFMYDERILIEEFIPGRELTVGILDSDALPVVEIIPRSGFYDFHSKYTHGETQYECPANIGSELTGRVQELGIGAHLALGCRDFSRVDFRLRTDGALFCLEVNTIPGMTKTSLLPKAAMSAGIPFPDLTEKVLMMALDRKVKDFDCAGI